MKLYWILFPIEDPRQAVETAKRILTKEKLDKQLMGQASTSPFMSIREGISKKVSFDTTDDLGDRDNLNPRYIKGIVPPLEKKGIWINYNKC